MNVQQLGSVREAVRHRHGGLVLEVRGGGDQASMILLLPVTEADCLGRQRRSVTGATNRHPRRRSAYRASGWVLRFKEADAARAL